MKFLPILALIASANAETAKDAKDITIGFFEGAGLAGSIATCFDQQSGIPGDALKIVRECKGSAIITDTRCIIDITDLIKHVAKATAGCKDLKKDAEKLALLINRLRNPEKVILQIAKDVIHLPNIINEVNAAVSSHAQHNYRDFGRDIGKLISWVTGLQPFGPTPDQK